MTASTRHHFEDADIPDEGRVAAAVVEGRPVALSRRGGRLGAPLPAPGGPLGEGSIEEGLLRCPWHGDDYDPFTGGASLAAGHGNLAAFLLWAAKIGQTSGVLTANQAGALCRGCCRSSCCRLRPELGHASASRPGGGV
jgi:nitrite reductase/ring-hydroxylating ferredoxin subunit